MDSIKYQIFISSTQNDLLDARDSAFKTILNLYHFPVGMEMFSADDVEQWEVIKDTIDLSDYYIVIIGHRYGSIAPEEISYTEKEYDYAKNQNIPILAFIRHRDVATLPEEREKDPENKKKLDNFIEKAKKSKMCDFWKTKDDLSTKIAIALPKIFQKNPRIGWVRGNKALSPEVSSELANLRKNNRELREENNRLISTIQNELPDFEIYLNNEKELKLNFVNSEDLKIDFNSHDLDFEPTKYPSKIEFESVPEHLKSYLSPSNNSKIQEYNQSLPSNKDIDKFNMGMEVFFRINATSINLFITVENIGNILAKEIYVDIEFPDEILVMNKNDIEDFEMPKDPLPANPIWDAEEQYKKDQAKKENPWYDYVYGAPNLPDYSFPFNDYKNILNGNHNQEIQTEIDSKNHNVNIRIKSLLHTRKIDVDEVMLVPLKIGQYIIKASIICAQFKDAKRFEIPLEVN